MSLLRSRPLAAFTLSPVEYADTRGRLPRRLGVAAVACLLMIQLTGCAPGEEEPQQPAAGESTTTAPEPTLEPETPETPQDPPQEPAAMANNNDEGAIAATEYFLTLIEYDTRNNTTENIEKYFGPSCTYCDSLESSTEQRLAENVSISDYRLKPQTKLVAAEHLSSVWRVQFEIRVSGKPVGGNYEPIDRVNDWTMSLGRKDSSWIIINVSDTDALQK